MWIYFGFWNNTNSLYTVTEMAKLCFIPLFWQPQGPLGCLKKRNPPLSSNLVVWCAKIGLWIQKLWKTSEIIKKNIKKWRFFDSFSKFLNFKPYFRAPNSNSVDNFASLDTPGGPEGVRIVELFLFEKNFSCFLDGGAAWRKKLFSWNQSLKSPLLFYMHKNWHYITLHSYNIIIFKEIHFLKPWFWNMST